MSGIDTTKKQKFTYKGVSVDKPLNITSTRLKKLIDELGKDYSFSVQSVVDFISKNY